MRSSIGPCGLDSQRFRASESSPAPASPWRKIPDARTIQRMGRIYQLKGLRAIAAGKTEERCVHAPAHREHLEELAHLRGRKQLLRFRGERRIVEGVLVVRFVERRSEEGRVGEEGRFRG